MFRNGVSCSLKKLAISLKKVPKGTITAIFCSQKQYKNNNMKRHYLILLLALGSCTGNLIDVNDDPSAGDTSSDSEVITTDGTISIVFSESGATVSGDASGIVTVDGNDVTAVNKSEALITYELSGTASDGFFKLYSSVKQVIELNNLDLTNPDGAAINNQSHKRTDIVVSGENYLRDGAVNSSGDYPDQSSDEDMKAALFSEGQLIFSGDGSLSVTAMGKSGITSDNYVVFQEGVTVNVSSSGGHGVRGGESVTVNGGTLTVNTSATGKKGISTDGNIHIGGGKISIVSTSSAGTVGGELTGAAGIKADGDFVIDGGTLDVTVSGKGCKGIACDGDGHFNAGTVKVISSGANYGSSSSQGPWGGTASSSESKSSKGIRFEGDLYFDGADVDVTCAYHEGIEAKGAITVTAGNVSATASDDAVNSGEDMTVSGGEVYAFSSGNDGLDANGDMYVKGGHIFAVGCGSPEVALDANTEDRHQLYISGGTLIAFGGVESGASITQPVLNMSSWTSNTSYSLYDGETLLLEFTSPSKGGSGIVISHPSLVSGSNYALKTSTGSTSLTASMSAQSGGEGGGGNHGGNPGGNPGGGPGGR